MTLRDDQNVTTDEVLLGRFIAAVKAVAAGIVEEPPATANHAARSALAKRIILGREAPNFGRAILELAIARSAALRATRSAVDDQVILTVVENHIEIFAIEGW
jgi:hypothetical protein